MELYKELRVVINFVGYVNVFTLIFTSVTILITNLIFGVFSNFYGWIEVQHPITFTIPDFKKVYKIFFVSKFIIVNDD